MAAKKSTRKKSSTKTRRKVSNKSTASSSLAGKKGDLLLIKRTYDDADFWIKAVDISVRQRKPKRKKPSTKKTFGHGIVPIRAPITGVPKKKSSGGGTSFHSKCDAPASTTASDDGGPKITNVNVHLLMWGSPWLQPTATPSAANVVNAIDSILKGPYMNGLKQYGVGSGQLADAFIITSPDPNNPFSDGNVQDMVWSLIDAGYFPEPDDGAGRNELFALIMPPGVNYDKGGGNFSGDHSLASDYDFPFDFDEARYCWVMNNGTLDSVTTIFSHELAEACTDPEGDGVQVNPRNGSSWHEIGDVCCSSSLLNGVMVQSYWSQKDNACIIPTIPNNPVPPEHRRKVTVTAQFHVVDPGIFSDDVGDFNRSKAVVLNDNNTTGQIVFNTPVVGGESSADLVLNLAWNNDLSVSVNFTSALYDGSSVDTSTSNSFILAKNTWQSWWINHKSGDWIEADTCHIDFDIHNDQQ